MASTDAKPVPVKNAAYRAYFPIYDAAGLLVAGATGLDSEVSKDGGTFADCTNEATQIATSSGCYYLDLTSTEMNADSVFVIIKSNEGLTQTLVIYPQESGDINVNLQSANADTLTASALAADAVAEINATVDTAISDAALATAVNLATVDTVVDAIKAVTDLLPDGGALTTLLSNVAAILTDTGTTLEGHLTDIEADTQDLQSRIPAALSSGNMKADVLAINTSTSAAARLALSAAQMIPGTVSTGTTSATTTVFAASDITEATADHYIGRLVLWTSGALIAQVTEVTDYELASGEGKFTVASMTEAPSNADTFLLV